MSRPRRGPEKQPKPDHPTTRVDWEPAGIIGSAAALAGGAHPHRNYTGASYIGPFYIAQDPSGLNPFDCARKHTTRPNLHIPDGRARRSAQTQGRSLSPAMEGTHGRADDVCGLSFHSQPSGAFNTADAVKETKRRLARLLRQIDEAHEVYSNQLSEYAAAVESIRDLSDRDALDRMWQKKLEKQNDELKRASATLQLSGDYATRHFKVLVESVGLAVVEAADAARHARVSFGACKAALKMLDYAKTLLEKELASEDANDPGIGSGDTHAEL
ncbi:unnamed protein product [Parascedosporium putredinis]|uniref:Uncharacterized protein n=1 Tax=Parascedosporium putredinis TaxID=1442378 RepID=A0A9P1HAF5_9PEZI|nr:unnamed protein product [Parascedosporium putredinis]CAI8002581.1 unnamed protein product [Parascedosporium putredinis]